MSVKAPPPAVLVIDIGSSGVRGAAFDTRGRALAGLEAASAAQLVYGPHGQAEVDLLALTAGVEGVLDGLHARLGTRPVLAVCMTSIASSLVPLGAAGPLAPVLSYADTRSAPEIEAVRRGVEPERVGCPAFSAYWPAQLRWWQQHHGHAERYASLPDYLLWRWTGEWVTSYSLASWTGVLDRHTLQWNEGALRVAGVQAEQLPALVDSDHPLFLSRAYAGRWPKLAHAPFYPGVSDGAAANVGSGALTPGRLALTVGSTSAVRVMLPGSPPPIPAGLWSYRVTRDWHLLGGALTEGGNLHAWLGRTLRTDRTLDAELLQIAPDSHGLTFLPSLGGTRSPDYDPHARGTVHGISYTTTPAELARAAMEGVACRLADLAQRLPTQPGSVFIASGKALLASRPWQQMLADALGRPLLLEDRPTGSSARGAALLTLRALGYEMPTEPTARRRVQPIPEHHEIYRQASQRMRDLTARVSPLSHWPLGHRSLDDGPREALQETP